MNLFQYVLDAIEKQFSHEVVSGEPTVNQMHLPMPTYTEPVRFQTQSRMWFKLIKAPSTREAEFLSKVGEMGAEMARGAKHKSQSCYDPKDSKPTPKMLDRYKSQVLFTIRNERT